MTTPGLRVDQVADAFVSVPGDIIQVAQYPASTVSIDSTTYKQFLPDTGSASFTTRVAGVYQVELDFAAFATASGSGSHIFKIVIDEGTANEVTIGDVESWLRRTSLTEVAHYDLHFAAYTTLTAGVHTLKVYGKRYADSLTLTVMSSGNNTRKPQITLTAVSGSGAGGILAPNPTYAPIVSIDTTEPSWEEITPHTKTITTASGERLLISHVGTGYLVTTGRASYRVKIVVDSTTVAMISPGNTSQWEYSNISFTALTEPLTAGEHTVRVYANKTSGDQNWTYDGYLSIVQYRGGLVPVRKDGVEVLSTPAAFNFIGSGCKVTNVGGSANIEVAGAEGFDKLCDTTIATTAITANQASSDPPQTLTGSTATVTTAEQEVLMLSFTGAGLATDGAENQGSMYVWLQIDSGAWELVTLTKAADTIDMWRNTSFTRMVGPLSAGSHTIKVGFTRWNANQPWTLYFSKLQIARFRGGYIQPENVPILEYNSASVVNVKAATGMDTEMRVQLNDGKQRRYTGTLTIDLTVSGRGGIDTGSEAVSTWYYLYAVPSAADDSSLAVLCSVTPPTTGPTGYSVWRYLGAVRNDASGNILKWYQRGDDFQYAGAPYYTITAGGPDGSPVALSIPDIPATAQKALFSAVAYRSSADGNFGFYADGDSGGAAYAHVVYYYGSGVINSDQFVLPMPTATKQIYYKRSAAAGQSYVYTEGWTDGYLSPRASQLQAKYVPDTKLAKGTWATATTVNFAASPGQPSTVRLTSKQDNKQRTFTGTLAWAVANGVADLGYDEAASQGNSKWLYWYLVPKSGDDGLWSVRASDNTPFVGPTGYTAWIYVWSTYIDGSGNLYRVIQNNDIFVYTNHKTPSLASAPDATPQSLDLSSFVPASATTVKTQLFIETSDGYGKFKVWPYGFYTGESYFDAYALAGADTIIDTVPLPYPTKSIHYSRTTSGTIASSALHVIGWQDGYY